MFRPLWNRTKFNLTIKLDQLMKYRDYVFTFLTRNDLWNVWSQTKNNPNTWMVPPIVTQLYYYQVKLNCTVWKKLTRSDVRGQEKLDNLKYDTWNGHHASEIYIWYSIIDHIRPNLTWVSTESRKLNRRRHKIHTRASGSRTLNSLPWRVLVLTVHQNKLKDQWNLESSNDIRKLPVLSLWPGEGLLGVQCCD